MEQITINKADKIKRAYDYALDTNEFYKRSGMEQYDTAYKDKIIGGYSYGYRILDYDNGHNTFCRIIADDIPTLDDAKRIIDELDD